MGSHLIFVSHIRKIVPSPSSVSRPSRRTLLLFNGKGIPIWFVKQRFQSIRWAPSHRGLGRASRAIVGCSLVARVVRHVHLRIPAHINHSTSKQLVRFVAHAVFFINLLFQFWLDGGWAGSVPPRPRLAWLFDSFFRGFILAWRCYAVVLMVQCQALAWCLLPGLLLGVLRLAPCEWQLIVAVFVMQMFRRTLGCSAPRDMATCSGLMLSLR